MYLFAVNYTIVYQVLKLCVCAVVLSENVLGKFTDNIGRLKPHT